MKGNKQYKKCGYVLFHEKQVGKNIMISGFVRNNIGYIDIDIGNMKVENIPIELFFDKNFIEDIIKKLNVITIRYFSNGGV